MVQGLNRAGLRAVIDVVYNHTPAACQDPKSILDRVVPGYYQRLSATGQVETSTCCANTATEHAMMEKLMIDSVITWAKEYKLDGFRFVYLLPFDERRLLIEDTYYSDTPGLDAGTVRARLSAYAAAQGWRIAHVEREESGVQTSSPSTSVPSASRPNSNFVSARITPRSRACSAAKR